MRGKLEHARGWFRKAESDLADARRTVASEGPYDTACFHAQQAAEKYLKGFLVSRGGLLLLPARQKRREALGERHERAPLRGSPKLHVERGKDHLLIERLLPRQC